MGLLSEYTQSASAGGAVLRIDALTWAQDPAGHPYVSTTVKTSDPGTANAVSAKTTQALDQYGNVTQTALYPFNNSAVPLKIFNNTYVSSTGFVANYVRNRLATSSVTIGGVTKSLAAITYFGPLTWYTDLPASLYNANPPVPAAYRGIANTTVTPAKTVTTSTYPWGSVYEVADTEGHRTTLSADSATNYAAPQTITTETYGENVGYTSYLAISQTTGTNGEQLFFTYDNYQRPSTSTNAFGATTNYSYSLYTLPLWQTANGPNGTVKTFLDGFGREARIDRNSSSSVSTVYAPCACSPLGKMQKVSAPYAYGQNPGAWTEYTYDGLGRTLSLKQPDGGSTTTYSYSGNKTTVTDPAGRWKIFVTDVEGNLVSVTEPDPANQPSGTLTTTYTYDWMNHLTGVSMPRSATTQTRNFVYDDAGRMTSSTNPENGTVTYSYNSNNTLRVRHDGKGQDTVYTYDPRRRLTAIARYPAGQANAEDSCSHVEYAWDSNPWEVPNLPLTEYAMGRVAAVQYRVCATGATVTEMYAYTPQGAVTRKRLHILKPEYQPGGYTLDAAADVDVSYSYTGSGAVSTSRVSYPAGYYQTRYDDQFSYGYDTMGRPVSLSSYGTETDPAGATVRWAENAQYDAAGRLTYWERNGGGGEGSLAEVLSYNVNGQLASLKWKSKNQYGQWGAVAGLNYVYSATQNNGQITGAVDETSGETISYTYDSLKRLVSAASAQTTGNAPLWNQMFGYDGFGNLTSKTLNGVTAAIPVNAATNRLSNATYDLNGNMVTGAGATLSYDVANRIVSATPVSGGTEIYGYAPDNRRIYKQSATGNESWTFYGAHGEKLVAFHLAQATYQYMAPGSYQYRWGVWREGSRVVSFAGRTIQETNGWGAERPGGFQPGVRRAILSVR